MFPQIEGMVLVVEASQSIRVMISTVLKEQGFSNITGMGTWEDALSYMETDKVSWIITPFSTTPQTNTLGLLSLCLSRPELRDVCVSVVVSQADRDKLKYAFELGLLSYFHEHTTREQFAKGLKELVDIAAANQGEPAHIAACYMRKYLTSSAAFTELVQLEQRLCSHWAGDGAQLVNLAKAFFECKDMTAGELALAQAETVNPNLEKTIQNLSSTYLGGKRHLGRGPGERFNVLGITDVLIVDGDEATRKALNETFQELGTPNITTCDNGEDAMKKADELKDKLGLIIQEWRVPKLPGYALIQRLRETGHPQTPIIVLSSLLQKDDRELIIEFGANDLCEKPYSKSNFVKKVVHAIQQERAPTDPTIIEMKVRKAVAAGRFGEAVALFTQAKSQKRLPRNIECLCAATLTYARGNFALASRHATEALRLKAPTVIAQGLLGRCLMKLGHYEAAIRCFEKAQSLSPKNVERMCALAEAYRMTNNEEKAEAALEMAAQLDLSSKSSQAEQLASGMASEDVKKICNVAKNLKSEDDIIALTNNRAVALVRMGKVEDGVVLYNSILAMLPSPARVKLVPVNYNIGLAFARRGDLSQSLTYLERVKAESIPEQEGVRKKAFSLYDRVSNAINKNLTLHLVLADEPPPQNLPDEDDPTTEDTSIAPDMPEAAPESERARQSSSSPSSAKTEAEQMRDMVADVMNEVTPGALRLHSIYAVAEWPGELKSLMETKPHYSTRIAMEKGART